MYHIEIMWKAVFVGIWIGIGLIIPVSTFKETPIVTLKDLFLIPIIILAGPALYIISIIIYIWEEGDSVILWRRK